MTSRIFSRLATGILLLAFSACTQSTDPVEATFQAYQIGGCRETLGKSTSSDSCFTYNYHELLTVDFCASGNCCPDSNRFRISHSISSDTIRVVISDTAAQLCRCNCVYVLHAEFAHLDKPSYLFLCERQDYSSQLYLYTTRVYRR